MRLTPAERDRLVLFSAAELARARRARGLRLNVPEATALVADTVAEAARDGLRLAAAIERGRSVLGVDDVLPGVVQVVREVQVEAVFDDGTRLAVVTDPFGVTAATDEVRGRLQGVFIVVVAGGPRIADVAHGAAAASIGVAAATAFGGIAVVVATIIAALLIPAFVHYRAGQRT